MRLGVFGGTFDPIHHGHLRVAEDSRQKAALDKVVFVPTGAPPLKGSGVASAKDRYAMVEMAVASNKSFELSGVEAERPDVSYSVDTAALFNDKYPGAELFFILGVDAFLDLHKWKEPDRLVRSMDFIIISRPGYEFRELAHSPYFEAEPVALDQTGTPYYEAPLMGGRKALLVAVTPLEISSTSIRDMLGSGQSVKYLLPEAVESFIITNGLYLD